MKRRTFDRIVSFVGLGLGVLLIVAAGLLNWGYSFADKAVTSQLAEQKITFPAANSPALNALPELDKAVIAKYAGMQLTTGKQAQDYADHFMAVHVRAIGGGKTYSEISELALAAQSAARMAPNDATLAAQAASLMDKRTTLFMGDTLRGLLGNAYAFWQLGQIAKLSALAALVGGLLMLVLSLLGLNHLRRTPEDATI